VDIAPINQFFASAPTRTVAFERVRPAAPTYAPATHAVAAGRSLDGGIPVDAPSDTDAQLWSVLTSQERSYFARLSARNVTYGPAGSTGGLGRGQSLDLRV
jgi:hypothetical protein